MKQLNKLQSLGFLFGGVLMVAGAGCFAFMWHQDIACWVYLLGAILFCLFQSMQLYLGQNVVVKRLKRIQSVAHLFFIFAGILMIDTTHLYFKDLFSDYTTYLNLVYNKWVVLLLVAAFLEMYTAHRIDSEMKKEKS